MTTLKTAAHRFPSRDFHALLSLQRFIHGVYHHLTHTNGALSCRPLTRPVSTKTRDFCLQFTAAYPELGTAPGTQSLFAKRANGGLV